MSTVLPDVGTLYRHPMGTKLNKIPVLFIPGNMGSADQVRSLSSPMHNKDEVFQYFAVHFKKPLSAIHGSILLSQAAFVNDALETVRALYKKPVSIMMVGHSLGGMVARTAVTLSNHPRPANGQCVVSDIIMLNTPNRGPAYSPDGSMEAIYNAVNKVWRESYYNESANCKRSRLEANDPVLAGQMRGKGTVSMNQKCALCASTVRLLSVSGGDLDILVPAHLTPIDIVAPLARNITHIKSQKGGGIFGGKSVFQNALGWLSPAGLLRGVMSLIYSGKESQGVKDKTKNNSIAGDTKKIGEESGVGKEEEAIEEAQVTTESATSKGGGNDGVDIVVDESKDAEQNQSQSEDHIFSRDPVYSLTLDEWNAHITPYEESVQFSVRSVQIKDVGFPIDHNALLWCRQLMGQVSQAMIKLVEKDEKARKSGKLGGAGLTSTYLTKLLPSSQSSGGKAIISRAANEGKKMIVPVAAFHMRNATNYAFSGIAEDEDRVYMAKILPLGYIQALAVSYVSTVWGTETLKWYMLLAIMALVVPIRRRLFALDGKERSDDWSIMTLSVLLHVEDLAPVFGTMANAILSVLLPPVALESAAFRDWFPSESGKGRNDRGRGAIAIVLSICGAVAARFLLDLWWLDAGSIHSTLARYNYRRWLHLVVSIFAALLLRAILLVVIYGARGALRLLTDILKAIARSTVYRKGTRKFLKRLRKSTIGGRGSIIPDGFYIPVVFLTTVSTVASHAWLKDSSAVKELGFGYWAFLTTILGAGVAAAVAVMKTLISPPHDDSAEAYHMHTSLGLLYLPLVVLSAPTMGFTAFALVGGGSRTIKPLLPSFFIFSPSEMNTLLSLACVVLHLWTATSYGPAYASLQDSQPLRWISIHILDRNPTSRIGGESRSRDRGSVQSFWNTEDDSEDEQEIEEQGFGGTLRIDGQCFHEDGGREAIFEEVTLPSYCEDSGNDCSGSLGSVGNGEQGVLVSPHQTKRSRARTPSQESPSPGVILGTTYRVVSCACAKDYRLKDQTEWCSFCRCKFCGGRTLFRNEGGWHPDYGFSRGGARGKNLLDDISANAYLAASLVMLGLLSLLYAGDMPHRHLYLAGAVAGAFLLRDMACTLGLLNP